MSHTRHLTHEFHVFCILNSAYPIIQNTRSHYFPLIARSCSCDHLARSLSWLWVTASPKMSILTQVEGHKPHLSTHPTVPVTRHHHSLPLQTGHQYWKCTLNLKVKVCLYSDTCPQRISWNNCSIATQGCSTRGVEWLNSPILGLFWYTKVKLRLIRGPSISKRHNSLLLK